MARLKAFSLNMVFSWNIVLGCAVALASTWTSAKTIEHNLGSIEIEGQPKRVVVLSYGALDLLDELNVEVVGVVKQLIPEHLSQYQAEQYASLGSLKEPNFEAIYMAKPDLIIAEGRQAEMYSALSDIAPTYMYQIDSADYWTTTQHHWRVMGDVFGQSERVEQMIADVQAQFDAVAKKAQSGEFSALTVMNNGNRISMFGHQSRFSIVYDEFGFHTNESKNVETVAATHGNLISFEYIADAKPDVMFILDRQQAIGAGNNVSKQLFDNALVNNTPAAQHDRIVFLDPAAWYLTAGGYHSTQTMVADVEKVFH